MPVPVRPARPQDAAAIAAVHVAGWRDGCAGAIEAGYLAGLSVDDATTMWRARLEHPVASGGVVVRVAVDHGGSVIGLVRTAAAEPSDAGPDVDAGVGDNAVGELTDLFVTAEHRGTGVAGVLHGAALTDLRAAGHRRAVVWVVAGNRRALRFYLRHGWSDDHTMRTAGHRGVAWRELRLGRVLAD